MVVMRIPFKSFRVGVGIPMHFSRLWNGVDDYSNASPKGRDVACHSFPQNRSDDIYSVEIMKIPVDFQECGWIFHALLASGVPERN